MNNYCYNPCYLCYSQLFPVRKAELKDFFEPKFDIPLLL